MHISKILAERQTALSFEFFPPKDEKAKEDLYQTINGLAPLRPAYVSVTYGAGGGTRKHTHELVLRLQKENRLQVIPHLTCVAHTQDEIKEILDNYAAAHVENVMLLRGDPPKDFNGQLAGPGFNHAHELVSFVKKHYPQMGIGVAAFSEGHPETPNRLKEMEYLKAKVDAGADYICTQMFFENRDFYDFCERCELVGINIPIVAGIMPITSLKSLKRMSELALGTRFPAKLLRALSRAHDAEGVERVGIHWASEQIHDLIDHKVRGVHFYTLNKSKATQYIYNNIGIKDSDALGMKLIKNVFDS